MKAKEIRNILNEAAPEEFALSWDNSGLILGREEKEIKRILITVDADDIAIKKAIDENVDMILSHHPLIFQAVKRITDEEFIGRRVLKLIQSDIVYFSMHTNYDVCRMGEIVGEKLGLLEMLPLEETGEWNGKPCGIGICGNLAIPESLSSFARRVKEEFDLEEIRCFGKEKMVRRIAVCPGSGGSVSEHALLQEADVFLSGDIGHHTGIDACARGMGVLDAGHYGLEYFFMEDMKRFLEERIKEDIEIQTMPKQLPYSIVM